MEQPLRPCPFCGGQVDFEYLDDDEDPDDSTALFSCDDFGDDQ